MSTLAKAIAITATAFQNKHDKGGQPYIMHCLRVMNDLHTRDEELQCIGVLHDVPEDFKDTNISIADLRAAGFSDRVLDAVKLLTHDKENMTYDDYIKRIATNNDARLVKLSDLRDNTNVTRLKGLTKKDHDRMEKYHRAYVYLSKI